MNNENVLLKSKDLTICVNNIQLSNVIAERNYIQQLYEEQRSINEQQTSEITELLNQLAQSTAIHTENEYIIQKNKSEAHQRQKQIETNILELNQQYKSEFQSLKEQLKLKESEIKALQEVIINIQKENEDIHQQLQQQIDENVNLNSQIQLINQRLMDQFSIQPDQISQFSTKLKHDIQELLNYQNRLNKVIQQVSASNSNLDRIPNQEVESNTTEPIKQYSTKAINNWQQEIQSISQEQQKFELLIFLKQQFTFLQFTADDFNQINTILDSQQIKMQLNTIIQRIVQTIQCLNKLEQNIFTILQACYFINQLIQQKYISDSQFWEAISFDFQNSSQEQFKLKVKKCCLLQLTYQELYKYQNSCETIDQSLKQLKPCNTKEYIQQEMIIVQETCTEHNQQQQGDIHSQITLNEQKYLKQVQNTDFSYQNKSVIDLEHHVTDQDILSQSAFNFEDINKQQFKYSGQNINYNETRDSPVYQSQNVYQSVVSISDD
ncbi:Hypothetical_protein [Hexamita inflata]|uniref:Hypothetical_protein n=1 Tax=Hexamita inflata TaxID=28002 RepID=A0AA86RHX7_9EUKA|nr:Hypothetical protein HINF_LOCUS62336 [Hexamita inflata]